MIRLFGIDMPPALFWVGALIFGLALGSFTTCVVYRVPRGISIWKRHRSFCAHCQKSLTWQELIPVFSYLRQRGRCKNCHSKIGMQDLVIEIIVCVGILALAALSLS